MRRSERIEVDASARLHPNQWSSLEVDLLDWSAEGFRAHCDARVRRGEQVTLELPGAGPAIAFVSWVGKGEFGASFLEPQTVDPAALAAPGTETLLARLLVRRAAAHKAQLWDRERQLRRRIEATLPVRRD